MMQSCKIIWICSCCVLFCYTI